MTRDEFTHVVEKYLADVLTTAVDLFDEGVADDRCIPLATQLVDAKDLKQARARQSLLVSAQGTLPRRGN